MSISEDKEKIYDVRYKVLLVGESGVGKTSLIRKLVGTATNKNHMNMLSTIGIDFVKKLYEVDGAKVQLEIWDTAGQERFRSITKMHYRGTKAVVFVYDVADLDSFTRLNFWLESIDQELQCSVEDTPPMIIIGNKSDLEDKREVPTERGEKLADEKLANGFWETSAKQGTNVHACFEKLAYTLTDTFSPKLMDTYKKNDRKASVYQRTDIDNNELEESSGFTWGTRSIKLDKHTEPNEEVKKKCCSSQ
ncbi:unnamed protein product [Owenia fusiformis]|uniref:Uncharacterized protein n=2 Tax=Owenia fusiformis TaxID=6347 RepID=A0A8J1UKY5_OWEFU|nr:unnamed protein product [Owenia fusiformis]